MPILEYTELTYDFLLYKQVVTFNCGLEGSILEAERFSSNQSQDR